MKFRFMKEHRSEFPVVKMSKVLGVSASGFYRWLRRLPSRTAVFRQHLRGLIQKAYDSHGGTAGSRTISADLKGLGIEGAGRNRIAREMRAMRLKCKARRRFVATTDVALPRGFHRLVQPQSCRMGFKQVSSCGIRHKSFRASRLSAKPSARAYRPQRQGDPVCLQRLQGMPGQTRLRSEHV
jgi:hypothetical protein